MAGRRPSTMSVAKEAGSHEPSEASWQKEAWETTKEKTLPVCGTVKCLVSPFQTFFTFFSFITTAYRLQACFSGTSYSEKDATPIIEDSDLAMYFAIAAAFAEFWTTSIRQYYKTQECLNHNRKTFSLLELAEVMGYENAPQENQGRASERLVQIDNPGSDYASFSHLQKMICRFLIGFNLILFLIAFGVTVYTTYISLVVFAKERWGQEVADYGYIRCIAGFLTAASSVAWMVVSGDDFFLNLKRTCEDHTKALLPKGRSPFFFLPIWFFKTFFSGFFQPDNPDPLSSWGNFFTALKDSFFSLRAFLSVWVPFFSSLAVAALFYYRLISDKYGNAPPIVAAIGAVAMLFNNIVGRATRLAEKNIVKSFGQPYIFNYEATIEKAKNHPTKPLFLSESAGISVLATILFFISWLFTMFNHFAECFDTMNSLFKTTQKMGGVDPSASNCSSELIGYLFLAVFISLFQFVTNAAFKAAKVNEGAVVTILRTPAFIFLHTCGKCISKDPEAQPLHSHPEDSQDYGSSYV